ncbi:MAG: 16S rRNA (guanine(527)-N(7))-methyltransferase RsmG [Treponema sp.]|nr:16S rRNA (guanine(527)-N(7))-methyltransferase RsmG [Treponema sp.]
MSDKLHTGIEKLGFSGEKAAFIESKMDSYIKEIQLFNQTCNLVGTDDYDELAVNHVLDSLAGAPYIEKLASSLKDNLIGENEKLVIGDIGSGSGFPGIVLATVFPEYDFRLIERMKKRCSFLENTIAVLGLQNVTVMNKEAERVHKKSLDMATFRAFRPLTLDMTKTILAMLKLGGIVAAYKARSEKIVEEMAGIKEIVDSYEQIPLTVPYLTVDVEKEEDKRERNLVVFYKK